MFGLISKKKLIQTAINIIAETEASTVDYARDRYATLCYKNGHENALRGLLCRLKLNDGSNLEDMLRERKQALRSEHS